MSIKIAVRLKPFSHTPGVRCVIPRSSSTLQAFPTLLRIDEKDCKLPLTGPVHNFTVQQDLEHDCVMVFGRAKEGYFRLKIKASHSGFEILSEKGPIKSAKIEKKLILAPEKPIERLSLGSHRAQDWDLVQRRSDLKEILPLLFCLGQKIPEIAPQPLMGTALLLALPDSRDQLEEKLLAFLKAAFSGTLVPRLNDDQHQGLVPEESIEGNPFFLLQEGSKMIRSLFFQQEDRKIRLLPHLPISLDAGRMTNIQVAGVGQMDLEWSKKLLKRVVLRVTQSGEIFLDLQKQIQSFRVGKKKIIKKGGSLLLESGAIYYLDRFEK